MENCYVVVVSLSRICLLFWFCIHTLWLGYTYNCNVILESWHFLIRTLSDFMWRLGRPYALDHVVVKWGTLWRQKSTTWIAKALFTAATPSMLGTWRRIVCACIVLCSPMLLPICTMFWCDVMMAMLSLFSYSLRSTRYYWFALRICFGWQFV